MKVCNICGSSVDENAAVCPYCSATFDTYVNNGDNEKNTRSTVNVAIIASTAIIIVCIIAITVFVLNKDKNNTDEKKSYSTSDYDSSSTSRKSRSSGNKTTGNTSYATESSPLYRPDSSLYIDQYSAYVFCTDTDVQDYVKMRYGPDKTVYDIVMTIDNYETVVVETKSVNGWTLCSYNGTEGWIRSDFIFK